MWEVGQVGGGLLERVAVLLSVPIAVLGESWLEAASLTFLEKLEICSCS